MKICLVILDGWGFNSNGDKYDAINNGKCLNMRRLSKIYPSFLVHASGEYVGLPPNTMGNSEVGHLTIGSGRIIDQYVSIISRSIENKTISNFFLPVLNLELTSIHVVIMISDGGIHSHIDHLFGVLDVIKNKFRTIFIHGITDGRDTAPKVAISYINKVLNYCSLNKNCKLVSLGGRYYAMDRDNNKNRIEEYFNVLTKEFEPVNNINEEINKMYEENMSDETLKPFRISVKGIVERNDTIIFLNFRSDRMRQLVKRFISNGNRIFTMVEYEKGLPVEVLYKPSVVHNTLSEVLSSNGIPHSHIAESEKYAHVTYFFNGGNEKQFENEKRFIIDSPKVNSFDEKPEMSSAEITETVNQEIESSTPFIVTNFASPDMVGHTGNYEATLKAVAKVDECVGSIYNKCQERGYVLIITADHGNAEVMFDEKNNTIYKKHTSNKVPLIVCNKKMNEKKGEWGYFESEYSLCDVSPTILKLFGLEKPVEMTGTSVLK